MTATSERRWLGGMLSRACGTSLYLDRPGPRKHRTPRVHLLLEPLEDRCVPSAGPSWLAGVDASGLGSGVQQVLSQPGYTAFDSADALRQYQTNVAAQQYQTMVSTPPASNPAGSSAMQAYVIVSSGSQTANASTAIPIEGSPFTFFANGNRLTVLSTSDGAVLTPTTATIPYATAVFDTVIDFSVPTAPRVVQETMIPGSYIGAEAVGGQVYVAVANNLVAAPRPLAQAGGGSPLYEAEAEYVQRIAGTPDSQLLPAYDNRWLSNSRTGDQSGSLSTPPNVYQAAAIGGTSLLTIMAFDGTGAQVGPIHAASWVVDWSLESVAADFDPFALVINGAAVQVEPYGGPNGMPFSSFRSELLMNPLSFLDWGRNLVVYFCNCDVQAEGAGGGTFAPSPPPPVSPGPSEQLYWSSLHELAIPALPAAGGTAVISQAPVVGPLVPTILRQSASGLPGMPLPAPVSGTNQIITPQLPAGAVGPFGVGLVPNGVAPLPLEAGRGSGEWGQAPTVIANPAPPPATDERRADEPRHVPVSAITDAALSPAERILADAYFVGDVPTAAAPVSVPPAVASPPPTSERKKPAARPSLAARVTRAVLGIATCLAGYQVLHDAAANRRSKRPRLAQESVPPLAPPVSLSPETPHSGTKGKV